MGNFGGWMAILKDGACENGTFNWGSLVGSLGGA